MNNKTAIKYLASPLLVFGLCTLCYFYFDKPTAYAMLSFTGSPVYILAEPLSYLGESKIWALFSIIVFIFIGRDSYRKKPISTPLHNAGYIALSVVVAMIIAGIFKVVLARYRPELLFSHGLYGFHFFSAEDNLRSMPSGHAVCIFAVATALSVLYRRYSILFFAVAVTVALTRLVLQRHYLGDVVFGSYVGIVSALLVWRFIVPRITKPN